MDSTKLAGCVISSADNRILLLHRNTKKRKQWEIPGGKLDLNEDATRAALREVREETGVEVEIMRELGTQSFNEDGRTLVYTWFLAGIVDGDPTVQNPETHDKLQYFSMEELQQIEPELSPNVRNFLGEVRAGTVEI
jgi:8-oxo-dGTP diphosphatase